MGKNILLRIMNRTASIAYSTWSENVRVVRRQRYVMQKAMQRARNGVLSKTFNRWDEYTSEMLDMKSKMRKAAKMLQNRSYGKAWNSWSEFVTEKKRMKNNARRAIRRWKKQALSRSFHGWLSNIKARKRYRLILRRTAIKMKYKNVVKAFNAWFDIIHRHKKVRRKVTILLRKKKKILLSRAIQKWKFVPKKKKRRIFDRKRLWEEATRTQINAYKKELRSVEGNFSENKPNVNVKKTVPTMASLRVEKPTQIDSLGRVRAAFGSSSKDITRFKKLRPLRNSTSMDDVQGFGQQPKKSRRQVNRARKNEDLEVVISIQQEQIQN